MVTIAEKQLTVDVRNGRLIADPSVAAYEDGAFYDNNGGRYYRDIFALAQANPNVVRHSDKPYVPPDHSSAGKNHDTKKVTTAVQAMKGNILSLATVKQYLPFYSSSLIRSNIGATYKGQLAAFMWTPKMGGSRRGNHYSLAQYRTEDGWMSVKGSDGKTVEATVVTPDDVYCTFGMGDFLLLKSTGLNYLCFGGDGAARNSPHANYIRSKVGSRTVRLIADNDESGEKTAGYLKGLGLRVIEYDWTQLGANAKKKMDLRDIGWLIKKMGGNITDLVDYLTKDAKYV